MAQNQTLIESMAKGKAANSTAGQKEEGKKPETEKK